MNGIVIINKPKGMTSQTVCLKLKRILNAKKCGHNGTLDPDATGVMVVAVNQATKALKLVSEHDKEYIATIVFGYDTKTLDMSGEILKEEAMNPSLDEIKKAMDQLVNQESQIPPMTSAVKVNGKKLYEYQRSGIEFEPEPRNVRLYSYTIEGGPRIAEGHVEIDIRIAVSKGYFVRSMARDLGKLLGGCAVLKELIRTKSGEYSIENAVDLEDVKPNDITPVTEFFKLPTVEVLDYMIPLVQNGIPLDQRQTTLHSPFFVSSSRGIIALYEETEEFKYKPVIIFKEK